MEQKDLKAYKEDYESVHMSEDLLEQMKKRMQQAKQETQGKKIIEMGKRGNRILKIGATAAAVALVFVALPNTSASVAQAMEQVPVLGNLVSAVTFRDYQYDDGKNMADVDEPKLVAGDTDNANVAQSVTEVNAEIAAISERYITEFENNMRNQGYQDITIKHEVISTTDDYFTLKLMCYQAAGSGSEEDYYYTIDLATGQRLALADLFKDGADYVTPISKNIKKQMRAQMKADENVMYWIDDPEVAESNFDAIAADQSFYLNDKGNIVICFNEGDVGPMSMGCPSFEIPHKVVSDILK